MVVEENQPEVYRILKNSIARDRLTHAYLFEGDKGTGKKDTAFFLAKAILCKFEDKPCGVCSNCKRIDGNMHLDVIFVEPDGQSIKKDQVLAIHEEFKKKSLEENNKVFIISNADKMTTPASNSMLKFIEEPYIGTTIILLTNSKNLILPTIISRCQVIGFNPLNSDHLIKKLINEGIGSERSKLLSHFTNSLDSAIELNDEWFDDAVNVAFKLFTQRNNALSGITIVQSEWMSTFDNRVRMEIGLELLIIMYRDLLCVKHGNLEQVVNERFLDKYTRVASLVSETKIAENILYILEAERKLKANVQNQLLMDQLAIKLGT